MIKARKTIKDSEKDSDKKDSSATKKSSKSSKKDTDNKDSGKNLIIVESPAKAKTIKTFLDNNYEVVASKGHIRDLPKHVFGITIKEGAFTPSYEITKEDMPLVKHIQELHKSAKTTYIATDEDREGEAIGFHIIQALKGQVQEFPRIAFHEITKSAIINSLKNPRVIDMDKVNAQQARRLLDRIVGFKLSGLLSQKISRGLSAGRVQSSALKILVDREREIRAFKPQDYYLINGLCLESNYGLALGLAPKDSKNNSSEVLGESMPDSLCLDTQEIFDTTSNNEVKTDSKPSLDFMESSLDTKYTKDSKSQDERDYLTFELIGYKDKKIEKLALQDKGEVDDILKSLRQDRFKIDSINTKERTVKPSAPFMTSTLQQTSSTTLGFSPTRTMSIAQKLYEGVKTHSGLQGVITYMRTDSLNIAKEALDFARKFVKNTFGQDYLPQRARVYTTKQKNAQEAHEAIRPTNLDFTPQVATRFLNSDELKLYTLIFNRFIASQMKDAIFENVNVSVLGQDSNAKFRISGRKLLFDGFYRILNTADKDRLLPDFKVGQSIIFDEIVDVKKTTEAPPHYSEAGLIKMLEGLGIGRPSTYAPTIRLLVDRNYVKAEGKQLLVQDIAFSVIEMLEKNFDDIVDSGFSATLEGKLDEIATHKRDWQNVLWEFYEPFIKQIESGKTNIASQKILKPTGEFCPECGGELVVRSGRYGEFISCGNYPQCKYIKKDSKDIEFSDEVCEKCGAKMQIKMGKRGKFLACSAYPKCKNAKPINKPKTLGVMCPKCGGTTQLGTQSIAGLKSTQTSGVQGRNVEITQEGSVVKKSVGLDSNSSFGYSGGGEIVERFSKRGVFYGCSNYPKCNFILNNMPTKETCKKCGAIMCKHKTKENVLVCSGCKDSITL